MFSSPSRDVRMEDIWWEVLFSRVYIFQCLSYPFKFQLHFQVIQNRQITPPLPKKFKKME